MTIKHLFLLPQAILTSESLVQKNIKAFFVGKLESDVAPLLSLGEELYDMVLEYDDTVFGFQSGK
jgi:hypothetical protein